MANRDDMTEATAIDNETMFPIEIEGGEASFPAPEEMRSSFTSRIRGRNSASTVSAASVSKKTHRWLWVGVGLSILLALVIIVPSVVLTQNKNNNSSSSNSNEALTRPRPSLDSVIAYITDQNVSDAALFSNMSSPQYQAAQWLAQDDGANLPVPSTDVDLFEGYSYMCRYIMALNYFALGGDTETWVYDANFLSEDGICNWNIFGQVNGHVLQLESFARISGVNFFLTALNFPFMNLQGSIPAENGLIVTLTYFSWRFNALGGEIPSALCSLTNMGVLHLDHNALTGSIPSCVGSLQYLDELLLHNNILEGSLPTELANLKGLSYLFIDDNMLTGDPAPIFNQLKNMFWLYANNNEFSSEINSTFLAKSSSLNAIDLSHNNFTSTDRLPDHFFSFPKLEVLDLSKNQLVGSFPSDIPKNSFLVFLAVYENSLNGMLTSLANLTSLIHLDLSINKFNGPIDPVGGLVNLTYLFLSENPFEAGPVPDSFAQLKLVDLSLRNTHRVGPLPDFIGRDKNLTTLTLLDLGSNNFSGTVPASYGELSNLQFLLLNDNENIEGEIPTSFMNLTLLEGAFLDGTSLNSTAALDLLCDLPNFKNNITGQEVLYVNCDVTSCDACIGCQCCNSSTPGGCSEPLLANLDASWANGFGFSGKRDDYFLRNDTGDRGSGRFLLHVPKF